MTLTHAGGSRSLWWRCFLILILFMFAGVYRFNALGGSLGGFDNDHFLHFVYAKQVQAVSNRYVISWTEDSKEPGRR